MVINNKQQTNNVCKECNNKPAEAHCKFCNKPLCIKCSNLLYFSFNNNSMSYKLNLIYSLTEKKGDESMASTCICACQDCRTMIMNVYTNFDFQKNIYNTFKYLIIDELKRHIQPVVGNENLPRISLSKDTTGSMSKAELNSTAYGRKVYIA